MNFYLTISFCCWLLTWWSRANVKVYTRQSLNIKRSKSVSLFLRIFVNNFAFESSRAEYWNRLSHQLEQVVNQKNYVHKSVRQCHLQISWSVVFGLHKFQFIVILVTFCWAIYSLWTMTRLSLNDRQLYWDSNHAKLRYTVLLHHGHNVMRIECNKVLQIPNLVYHMHTAHSKSLLYAGILSMHAGVFQTLASHSIMAVSHYLFSSFQSFQ